MTLRLASGTETIAEHEPHRRLTHGLISLLKAGFLVIQICFLLAYGIIERMFLAAGQKRSQAIRTNPFQWKKDLLKVRLTRDPEAVEAVGKVLADDWVNLEPDRRGPGKAGMMEFLHQRSGPVSPSSVGQQDLRVFLFGNTAVATYFFWRHRKARRAFYGRD